MCQDGQGQVSVVRAVEFDSKVAPGGEITLPAIAREIPPGEPLRVVLMREPSVLDMAWVASARERFEATYSPDDAVYEQLIDDAAIR
jgi:hypothetical protein